jgi:predicted ATP-binding protein involved in virulence
VYLDGDYLGKTPLDISKVVVGSYSIKLTKFGYASVEKKIDVSAGKSTRVDETLSMAAFILSSTIAILIGIISVTITSLIFLIKVITPRRKKDALSKSNMKDKQKIDFAKRKEIIELNTQDGIKHKDISKINPLYEKAQELEKRGENKESIETYEKIIDINEFYLKAWEGLEKIYEKTGESEKRYSALKKIRSITEFIDFATNAAQKINLQQFELQNLEFFDNLFWSFQPQINILLGKNGYGKTYLLRLLISLLQKDDDISSEFFNGKKSKYLFCWDNAPRGDINRLLRFLVDDLDIDWAENVKIHKSDDGKTIRIFKDGNSAEIKIDEENEKATLKISDGRSHGLKVKKENGKLNIYTTNFVSCDLERNNVEKVIYRTKTVFEESMGKVPVLAIPDMRLVDKSRTKIEAVILERPIRESGAYHFLYEKPFEEVIQNFLHGLCIRYMDKGKSFEQPLFQLLHKVVRELTDKEFRFGEIVAIGEKFEIKVITEGNKEKPLLLQKASQGTLSVLSIFGLIYYYLRSVFPDTPEEELLKKPAIVFIDEVDAHLHPSWQQRIIGLLRENFPNVQFIVTAYSPLVVAGCYENEVAVLRKGKGGFSVEQFERDFIGYEAKDLYQIIFEMEEKDETYLQYTAQGPFKKEIESEITRLETINKENALSKEDKRKLQKYYDDLHYIEQAQKKFDERTQTSNLLIQNRRLKAEIEKLKR